MTGRSRRMERVQEEAAIEAILFTMGESVRSQ